jgi:molecular chaperone GrpE (heat shock protein)
MSQSELRTIVMEQLKAQAEDNQQNQQSLRRDLEALSARQTESEKQLTRLSEIYRHLLPLIENIESIVSKKR